MRFLLIACFLLPLVLPLAACGKKPSQLDAPAEPDFTAPAVKAPVQTRPDGKKKDPYPQTYPKPWL